MTVDVDLLDELGLDAEDPEVQAAWEDAEAAARLVQTLVHARQRLGLNQREVAKRMGTTQSAVSDLERTAGDPRLSTLQRFSRALGLKIALTVVTPEVRYMSRTPIPVGHVQSERAGRPIRWHLNVAS